MTQSLDSDRLGGMAPRVPPRFVPTLTEVLPPPDASQGLAAAAAPPASRAVDPPALSSDADQEPTGRISPTAWADPLSVDRDRELEALQAHVLRQVVQELPGWLDEALTLRLRLAIAETMPEIEARLRTFLDERVAQLARSPDQLAPRASENGVQSSPRAFP